MQLYQNSIFLPIHVIRIEMRILYLDRNLDHLQNVIGCFMSESLMQIRDDFLSIKGDRQCDHPA